MWVVITHMVPWVLTIQKQAAIPIALTSVMNWLTSLFQANGETHPAVVGFIILSGYCIHRSGLRSYRDDIVSYAVRRFFRIYPVFFIATIFGVAAFLVGFAINSAAVPSVSGTFSISAVHVVEKLVALEAINPNGYFSSIQGNGPLQTVAVEMWLYAAYPAALLLIDRWSERAWWLLMFICWSASIAINTYVPEWRPWSYNSSLIAFLPFWWLGAKFADKRFAAKLKRFIVAPALVWLLISFDHAWGGQVAQLLAAIRQVAFAMCFACLVSSLDALRNTPDNAVSELGAAGYSIYAFHAPIVYTAVLLGAPWWLIVAIVIVAGLVSFRFLETPMIRRGKLVAAKFRTSSEPAMQSAITPKR
ncbi:Peptidoglycan/LPS O-acetylase OafA/YrhL, contains acyltransferase and SGNH-hydrolase domains [Paraburkholderia sartisoli]|uniref:Peptidoglycan/LPS O-acetylase OafA/YrhL, contains acyltransferase and SGNH-hydrolase domains n=2 Tax=Paraburkholderia sartisoli TaxID=83784 RepID=A0A1H4CRU2_9BURK|nr:Peptidoglycan/LPS O-acetylase OafA/YrhL, contains acyltransferase and SGNH-hydrolase domains [Paraburkholderia sartisoli]